VLYPSRGPVNCDRSRPPRAPTRSLAVDTESGALASGCGRLRGVLFRWNDRSSASARIFTPGLSPQQPRRRDCRSGDSPTQSGSPCLADDAGRHTPGFVKGQRGAILESASVVLGSGRRRECRVSVDPGACKIAGGEAGHDPGHEVLTASWRRARGRPRRVVARAATHLERASRACRCAAAGKILSLAKRGRVIEDVGTGSGEPVPISLRPRSGC
jgi:hypothetical protein